MHSLTFYDLSPAIQIHILAAILATVLGPIALYRKRRDIWHKTAGYIWVAAMAITATSAFLIHTIRLIGPFSPIHLLSIITLYGLYTAIAEARAGKIAAHRATMTWMYFTALAGAGTFALLPGRALHQMLFGHDSWPGFVMIAAVIATISIVALRRPARTA